MFSFNGCEMPDSDDHTQKPNCKITPLLASSIVLPSLLAFGSLVRTPGLGDSLKCFPTLQISHPLKKKLPLEKKKKKSLAIKSTEKKKKGCPNGKRRTAHCCLQPSERIRSKREFFFFKKKAIKRLMVLFLRGDRAWSIQRTNIRTI